MNQDLNSNEQKTTVNSPLGYLKRTGKCLMTAAVSFSMCILSCFRTYPHYAWILVLLSGVIYHFIHDAEVKSERDRYSREAAVLMDSISRINMEPVRYTTINNKPAQAIRPTLNDSIK